MKLSSKNIIYLKLFLALLFWAGIFFAAKIAVVAGPALSIAFLRYIIASILLLFILYYKTGKLIPKLKFKQWLSIFLVGFFGVFLNNLFFLMAETSLTGSATSIIYAFAPCLTIIFSVIIFKTCLNKCAISGVLISVVGAIGVINYTTNNCGKFLCFTTFSQMHSGSMLAVLGVLSFASYSIMSKYTLAQQVSSLVINTYMTLCGCLLFGFSLLCTQGPHFKLHYSISFWLSIIYMAVFATVLAYLWYTEALNIIGVDKTVIFQNLIPLLAVIIGVIFMGETMQLGEAICGALIITGILITNKIFNKNKKM